MLYGIVGLLVVIVDQWVKYWVAGAIPLESTGETFIPGILSLVNLHNDGAAFSFLSGGGARIYFIILTGVFTLAVIIALATNFISGRLSRWSIVLVTAGGLSNCLDRVISGYVQDMFKVELFNFPVFNVADIFITVFCLLFVIAIIFEKDKKDDDLDEFDLEDDEEEDRPARPSLRKKQADASSDRDEPKKKGRKSRKAKYEDEYEQYKAARMARQQQSGAPAAAAAPAANAARVRPAAATTADPFAEWEKANARVESQQANSYAAKAAGINPSGSTPYSAPRPAAAAQQPPVSAQPRRSPAPAPAPTPVARPVQAPVQTPAPTPVQAPVTPPPAAPKKADSSDFSLDDILAEFK